MLRLPRSLSHRNAVNRRDRSDVDTRAVERQSKEKAHDEADSQSMIAGVTEEGELKGKIMTASGESGQGTAFAATPTKKEHQNQQQQAKDVFTIFTDDLLFTPIFEFVGLFEYRFVAILNRRFQRLYSEFQRNRIHYATPTEEPLKHSLYYPTSLTLTASVAESVKRAKELRSDMENREWNYFIKLRKRKGNGMTYGSFYDVMDHTRINGTDPITIITFLRDEVALPYGNLEILKWLGVHGCPWNKWTCAKASEYGHLEVLQWLRDHGCPWNQWTCSEAAGNGHLEVLQWARANGCPWGRRTCALAARNGHLEVLKWARENGCPWGRRTCSEAARNGHLEVFQWARANGCPE